MWKLVRYVHNTRQSTAAPLVPLDSQSFFPHSASMLTPAFSAAQFHATRPTRVSLAIPPSPLQLTPHEINVMPLLNNNLPYTLPSHWDQKSAFYRRRL